MTDAVGPTLMALADGTRRAALEELATGPVSAGELADRLEVSPAALTRHLRQLRHVGLVRLSLDPEDARRHIYAIEPGPLRELMGWAERMVGFWSDQLASFQRQAAGDTGEREQ